MNVRVHRCQGRPVTNNNTTSARLLPPCVPVHRGANTALGARPTPASRSPSPAASRHRPFVTCQHLRPGTMGLRTKPPRGQPECHPICPRRTRCRDLTALRTIGNRCPVATCADQRGLHRSRKTPPRTTAHLMPPSNTVSSAHPQSSSAERIPGSRARAPLSTEPTQPLFSRVVPQLANAPAKLRRACAATQSAPGLPRAASFSRLLGRLVRLAN